MDRRRAAGALIALAACFACSAAAPTTGDHTGLDLYDGGKEGCYYNFQHYGEGDRIMTNEPCLNCTCHNRMLMCYLRVCPFTKAIGQDCTVEKRADQCCPIVTCPDVPVDLLTSTSTSSPAEYGGTGVGKLDNYGCSINGKYFPEGAKVPPMPNRPCEHCYCIRNMTTCVMQECTLHVDGCTPIYHKDVCCPVRYFCDHPEDEMPLLDDMTTTVRPTPGFLLTTTAETPTTLTQARRDCIEDDQLYPDGALIKTEKPCVHCYCMKGDIVCVVQECGTPMENEGKNCSSLPPREGQCCPDTYICEGDELTTNIATETPFEDLSTVLPTRRVSVEGSGYRNEPDELPYTETPTFVTEMEGSGEEQLTISPIETSEILIPEKQTTASVMDVKFDTTEEGIQYSPITTQVTIPEEVVTATTEPDKGQNTVPSDISEEESSEPSVMEKTTQEAEPMVTIPDITSTSGLQEIDSPEPEILATTTKDESKATEHTQISEQSTAATRILEEETSQPSIIERTTSGEEINTISEQVTVSSEVDEKATQPSKLDETTTIDEVKPTEEPIISDLNTIPIEVTQEQISGSSAVETTTYREEAVTISSISTEKDLVSNAVTETRRTSSRDEAKVTEPTTVSEKEEISEPSIFESTTHKEEIETTEPAIISGLNTIPNQIEDEESSKPSEEEITTTTPSEETKVTEIIASERETVANRTEDKDRMVTKMTEPTILAGEEPTQERSTTSAEYLTSSHTDSSPHKEDEYIVTTEPSFRKEDEGSTLIETFTSKEDEKHTTAAFDLITVPAVTSEYVESSNLDTNAPSIEHEARPTTTLSPEKDIEETVQPKEPTTESLLDTTIYSTKLDKESATTLKTEKEIDTITTSEKLDMPETTTINPEDNEISEDISPTLTPGRIPGEGDCLINGKTYRNDSFVPNTNKCHASCRCVSSIVKCDAIICSPQPEYMDNCQLSYDTPDSCCPTYICDHSKETIPPESHSQMSGTESPLPSPSIECQGDECQVSLQTQPPTISSEICASGTCTDKIDETPEITSCGSDDCGETAPKPTYPEGCTNDKCTQPSESCNDSNCQAQPTRDQPQDTSDKGVPEPCDSLNGCKEITIPDITQSPCVGESCTRVKDQPCDKESGCEASVDKTCSDENCVAKPEMAGTKDGPQICENQDDCKETKVPEIAASHCEGDSCIKEDCSSGKCVTDATLAPEVITDEEVCADENGCRKTSEEIPIECAEEDCRRIQTPDTENKLPSDCKDSECVQQKPITPTQEVMITVPLSTDSQTTEKTELETVTSVDQDITSQSLETITSVTEQIEKGDKKAPEEHETKSQETATEQLESASESPASEPTDNEQIMSESPTVETEITSELPEMHVTLTKSEEESTIPSEEIVTETEMHATSGLSSTDISLGEITKTKPSDEEDSHTDIAQVTESQERYTSQPEEVVTEKQETTEGLPELPVSPTKDFEESTSRKPEVLEQTETVTHIPDISVTESEKETREPESTEYEILSTKLPSEETKYASTTEPEVVATEDLSPKIQETATGMPADEITTLEPEVKASEPAVFETPEKDTDTSIIPEVTDVSITKEQELSSKEPTLSITESYERETELPQGITSIEEVQTEASVVDITKSQEPLTSTPYEDFDKQTTIGITEPSSIEHDIKITTHAEDITEIDEVKTELPESLETKDKESSTEPFVTPDEYYSKTTTTQDELLHTDITQTQDIDKPQETITSLSPSKGPEEYVTTTLGISVTEEEKAQTERPLSFVTQIQELDTTTSLVSFSEPAEIETKLPSEVPESTVSSNLPVYHATETSEMQDKPTTEPGIIAPEHAYEEIKTEPEVAFTERPYSLVTDLEKSTDIGVSIGETETEVSGEVTVEESPVTEQHESVTKASVSSVTEYNKPSVTVSEEIKTDKPSLTEIEEHAVTEEIGYSTEPSAPSRTESPYEPIPKETSKPSVTEIDKESEGTEKVAEAHVSPTTEVYEIPTQKLVEPGEDFYTALPEYTEQESTEKQELETKAPEESHSRLPEYTEEPAITELEEKSTEKSKPESESEERVTEISQPSKEENIQTDIPISVESPTTPEITQEPELVDHEEKTTEAQEEIISEQALDTDKPEYFTTKEQESHTEPSVSHTTLQKEITKIQEPSATEQENLNTITTESTETESGRQTTEKPKVTSSDQEYGTTLPKVEESQEMEIKTLEPSELTTKSTVEEIKTELPGKEPDEASPVTEKAPSIIEFSTEQNEVSTIPTLHELDHEETPAETPVSVVEEEAGTKEPELATIETQELDSKKPESTDSTPIESPEIPMSPIEVSVVPLAPTEESIIKTPEQTSEHEYSETTPYLVELEEHTHKIEEEVSTILPSEETIIEHTEAYETEYEPQTPEISTEKQTTEDKQTEVPTQKTEITYDEKEGISTPSQVTSSPTTITQTEDKSEKATEPSFEETTAQSSKPFDTQELDNKYGTESQKDQEILTSTPKQAIETEQTPETVTETVTPSILDQEIEVQTEKDLSLSTTKPLESDVSFETAAPEEEFIPATTKVTTAKIEEEASTQTPTIFDKFTKPEEKPEMIPSTPVPETPKPGFNDIQPTDEVPSPEEEGHFPPSGGYGQEPDYVEEDQAFGPGTCRYGGKVYVSAQQIPRDDPCDFCFCFRSDIICLQQSCPPPIHGCHEEPIQGFCCPRYECPVSMATTLNVTTTTTTTTTTLPPHFLPHAYKGAAQRRGCQIKGHTYKVGEVVRASSGPCLHCTCGGDGQMKCDPKACTPEPMLRQMIAAAVSAKRRR